MDEAGDPTPKYASIRELIKNYLPLPNISVPERAPKMKLPPLKLTPTTTLLSPIARQKLAKTQIKSETPFVTFERIDQNSGFLLYETVLPKLKFDPSILEVPKINDRAIVLIDDVSCVFFAILYEIMEHKPLSYSFFRFKFVVGFLSRGNHAHKIALNAGYSGKMVQILVENQG